MNKLIKTIGNMAIHLPLVYPAAITKIKEHLNQITKTPAAVMKAAARAGPDEPATRGVVSPQPLVLARQRRPR